MVVRLVSGGPLMTVDEVYPNAWIMCCWFDGNQLMRDTFWPAQLVRGWVEQKA